MKKSIINLIMFIITFIFAIAITVYKCNNKNLDVISYIYKESTQKCYQKVSEQLMVELPCDTFFYSKEYKTIK